METPISYWKSFIVLLAIILFALGTDALKAYLPQPASSVTHRADKKTLAQEILPEEGVTLPIRWGTLGIQMVKAGLIDKVDFAKMYASRGGVSAQTEAMLNSDYATPVVINQDTAGELLNLLWAFGLGNANMILADESEMMNPEYGGASGFASTAGWTLARGNVMEHYSRYSFVVLTTAQQSLVERVSRNIYRPCCGNATHFPDCNHGMAMLGLLELLAANGVSEQEMYRVALVVNSYWFPDTYLTIGQYLTEQGVEWVDADPKEILGYAYSSAEGYERIQSKVTPVGNNGGACGV